MGDFQTGGEPFPIFHILHGYGSHTCKSMLHVIKIPFIIIIIRILRYLFLSRMLHVIKIPLLLLLLLLF